MLPITENASRPQSMVPVSVETVLQVMLDLYAELHQSAADSAAFGPQSRIERDLGFDSLARVELLLRLERRFGVQLPEAALEQVNTVADAVDAVQAARTSGRLSRRPQAPAAPAKPLVSDRRALGAPESAATLNEVLQWHVEQHPQSLHAILLDGGRETPLTFAELNGAAQSIAGALQSGGVAPGATVALMLPTGVEYLEAFFGVLAAGAVPVPIYPPASPSQLVEHVHRHAGVLDNAGADALITVPEARGVAHALQARVPSLRQVWSVADLRTGEPSRARRAVLADSLAMLQYTSGSTGDPKGVMLTHRDLLANIRAMGLAIRAGPADVFVSWLPLYHDMGLIGAWLGSLYFGCLLVLMPPTTFLARPLRWLQAVHQYRGTLTGSPTFGYELCTRRLTDEDLRGLDLSSLRYAFCGAEPVHPDTLERFAERFASCGLRREVLAPAYGLAEAAVGVTLSPVGRGLRVDCVDRERMTTQGRAVRIDTDRPDAMRFASCGPALPGYRVRIVEERGSELPERHEGALQFTGPSATRGYYRNPEATRRLRQGDWLDTGDRAYSADGEIYITGRGKDMIIRRGQHIYPEEIENAVGDLEGVRKGCVVAFGSRQPQAATERLVVFAETAYEDPQLRRTLTARINERVMQCVGEPPDEVVLAPPRTVLKTSSGKLRRAATRIAYENGTLGQAPAAPALQMLRLALEGALLRLRRLRESGAHLAYGAYVWCTLAAIGTLLIPAVLLLPSRKLAWRASHRAARVLIKALRIPFIVTRESDADLSAPHVVVVNHSSYADSLVLAALLPDPHLFVAKVELERAPILGRCLRKLGTLFIDRSEPAQGRAYVAQMAAAVHAGRPVVVFPEGTFTEETGLRPFHLGAFQAAVAAAVPVLPIALRGTRSILHGESRLPRRGPASATIGPPLRPPPGEGPFDAAVHLRDAARDYILRRCGEPDLA